MNLLVSLLSVCLAVFTVQACRGNYCAPFCAGEIKDNSKMSTFYSNKALQDFNRNFRNIDEKFKILHTGKCNYKKKCTKYPKSKICAVVEVGGSGGPRTFRNFCELNEHNCNNRKNEYIYYHDGRCNKVAAACPSQKHCKRLKCNYEECKPVCAFPKNPHCAQPKTFPNYCLLKKFNCLTPQNEFLYWHETACYTDDEGTSSHNKHPYITAIPVVDVGCILAYDTLPVMCMDKMGIADVGIAPTAMDKEVPDADLAPRVSDTSDPTAATTSDPTTATTSDPTAATTSDTTAATTSDPTAATTSDPTAATTSDPTTATTSYPTAATTSDPTAATTSDPTAAANKN